MPRLIQNFRYRPEIDGLRAVAVLAVVLYHAGLGLSGGYIGVDVFFVVSGFLITSLIIKDLQEGRFAFSAFWERRARRIMPAMVVVVTTTLIAGWFLLLPHDYAALGKSATFQAIFGANIYFWRDTGYFGGAAEEKPLLHTWSLAVEEQFYLFMPIILFGIFRFSALRRRGSLQLMFAIGIIGSLVASVYGVILRPAAAFYLLPTRAWELLCGSYVALSPTVSLTKWPRLREIVSWIGLFGILIPCWFYTKNTPFPGLAAAPPCIGTALFIWASGRADVTTPQRLTLRRLLSARPVVFVGLISYSLYLWHWPLFAFSTYWSLQPMTICYRLAMVALGFVLAILSWRFVETPFRKKIFCATRASMLVLAGASAIAVLTLGIILVLYQGIPSRFPAQAIRYASAARDMDFIHEISASQVKNGELIAIGNKDPKAPIALLVWGDSHAMAAMSAFDGFLTERGLAGRQATASSTAPLVGAYWENSFISRKDAKAFNDATFEYIVSHSIPDVVLIGYWEAYTDDKGEVPLDSAMLLTVQHLVRAGVRPWVLLQVPLCRFDVPRALAGKCIFQYDFSPLLSKPNKSNGLGGTGRLLLDKLEAAGGHILDPRPCFLNQGATHYIVETNGIALYRDLHHLSSNGARMMLLPFIRENLHLPSSSAQETPAVGIFP